VDSQHFPHRAFSQGKKQAASVLKPFKMAVDKEVPVAVLLNKVVLKHLTVFTILSGYWTKQDKVSGYRTKKVKTVLYII
jgi:hypothetical protein